MALKSLTINPVNPSGSHTAADVDGDTTLDDDFSSDNNSNS